MDLSIIIISYNTKELLSRCLASVYQTLKNAPFSFEVIVIDNASADGSVAMIRRKFRRVVVLQNKTNSGFGKANNQGIRKSRGEYILLLNSDTEIFPDAVQKLYAFSVTHKKSFVGPKLVNPDGSDQTSCGPFFSLPIIFMSLFLKGDVLGVTRWSPKTTRKVGWVSGACIMAPKKIFLDSLLFDEGIFMYMDEIDLLFRAAKKGYDVYFYHKPVVMHVGSGSSTNKRKGPVLNIFRGFRLFYKKHYPPCHMPVLRAMLGCKAVLGIFLGTLTGNREMKTTYEEAMRLV